MKAPIILKIKMVISWEQHGVTFALNVFIPFTKHGAKAVIVYVTTDYSAFDRTRKTNT